MTALARSRQTAMRRPGLTLAAMCIAQAMILLDNTIVNVALPSIQHDLGDLLPLRANGQRRNGGGTDRP